MNPFVLLAVTACVFMNVAGGVFAASAPTKQKGKTMPREIAYHGIHPDDPGGRCGLPNPERGFRLEAVIGMPPGAQIWSDGAWLRGIATSGYSDDWLLMNARRYRPFGVTITQAYCYLDAFTDKPLTPEKLALLQRSLDRCRAAGIKVLLRFAYERNMRKRKGPSLDRILGHIKQLTPIIRANEDVIFVLQAGFVGAWGEWHSSARGIEKDHAKLAKIMASLLDALPKDRMLQVRVPKYKRWILEDPVLAAFTEIDAKNAFTGIPAARIGYHDDGFLANKTDGGTWPEPPHFANPGNPEFDYMTRESPYVAVDGELFWADQGGAIDGLRAAARLCLQHYASLSLTHAYSGYEGKRFSIDQWMETPMTADDTRRLNLPISDGYFTDGTGRPAARTVFEYIRDHLGYRIELQKARFPETIEKGRPLPVEIDLVNRGFSTFINPRPVELVLIDAAGELVARERTSADPRRWQPFDPADATRAPLTRQVRGEIPTKDLERGEYMVGLAMPDASDRIADDARFSVRVANRDVPWWTTADGKDGVNILGRARIVERETP